MLLKNLKKTISILLLLTTLLSAPLKSYAQPITLNPFGVSYFQPKFGINMGTFFNHQDFLFDFGLGLEELGYDFSVTFNGSFRPYYKTVFFKEADNLFWQVEEKVVQFSIDLEKRFYFLEFANNSKIGLYALLKAGYFFGTYKGLSKNRNQEFGLTPGGGFSWQFSKMSRFSFGYLYFSQNPYAHPHTFNLKLSLYINNEKNN
ncbi:hypothetical protein [Brumimicrobium sp.]|uniref:hypothetical protein n=1 Tax=Brumimicrobium sp. TaxID=2029867 RepID=UPI003A908804